MLAYSPIFKNVTAVKSDAEDYTKYLISGINGACLWFVAGLSVSAIGSLLLMDAIKIYQKMVSSTHPLQWARCLLHHLFIAAAQLSPQF
jgi:hypothetical protein